MRRKNWRNQTTNDKLNQLKIRRNDIDEIVLTEISSASISIVNFFFDRISIETAVSSSRNKKNLIFSSKYRNNWLLLLSLLTRIWNEKYEKLNQLKICLSNWNNIINYCYSKIRNWNKKIDCYCEEKLMN